MHHSLLALPILGIDVAKQTLNVVLPREPQKRPKPFANTPPGFAELRAWLIKLGLTRVWACVEATGSDSDSLACDLHEAAHPVSLVHPARIKAEGQSQLQRTKKDRADADLIARYRHDTRPRPWTPPPPPGRELQALVRHLDDVIETRQQLCNRLSDGPQIEAVLQSLRQLIAHLDAQIKLIEGQIAQHFKGYPDLQAAHDLLASIPGIGSRPAAVLLAEIEPLRDYQHSAAAVADAGLHPRQRQSGSSIKGQPRLSKTGQARVRQALYLPAVNALKYNPSIRRLAERLEKRGRCNMASLGAAMRKLLQLAFGVLKTGKPFDANQAVVS